VGQSVQFTDTSTNNPTSWSWTFGGGGTSTAKNPTHSFSAEGSYTVTLVATNGAGSDSISHTITVSAGSPPPPPTQGNLVYNGDFEIGSGSPTGWTLPANSVGSWSWDSTTGMSSAGVPSTHSAKIYIPGTVSRSGSPAMQSNLFPLTPNSTYLFAYWTQSSGAGGVYPMIANLVEVDASGNFITQHAISADFGTVSWNLKTRTFQTDPGCVQGYVRVSVPNGYGKTWIDGIQLYQQPSTPNLVFNSSFEIGGASPTGWTLPGNSIGTWSWDATTGVSSTGVPSPHSAKISIPGTVSVSGSPAMQSVLFPLSPNSTYLFTFWSKSSGAGGVYPMIANIVELDANGNFITQHGRSADFGTVGWNRKTKTFQTDPACVQGYVRVSVPNGYGITRIDRIQLNEQ
jgi:PKD repeat protein